MKLKAKHLALFMMITYMVSYITRINYGAVLVEMVKATGFTKTQLSIAVTGSFITYGAGQIVSGFFGDRISPKRLVAYGLSVTALINMILPFFSDPYSMAAVWCINGFAQAFMWPPLVRIMVSVFNEEEYKHAVSTANLGGSAGTVLIYLVSPVIISQLGWQGVFRIAALCAVIMLPIWLHFCPEITLSGTKKAGNNATAPITKVLFTPMLIICMLTIVLQGALRDGVTTWMPTYISETYHLSSAISILTGVILPLFSLICLRLTEYVHTRILRSLLVCSAVIFGIGTAAAAVLLLVTGHSAVASTACIAVLTGSAHGVNLLLVCMLPQYFKSTGRVALISGVLNACAYIGSAASTYLFPMLITDGSWNTTVFSWLILALLGTVFCLLCIPAWKKHQSN